MNEINQKTNVRSFFDVNEKWQGDFYSQRDSHFAQVVARRKDYSFEMLKGILQQRGGRGLDIGCGSGIYLLGMLDLGYQVFGMDYSPEMITSSQKLVQDADDQTTIQLSRGDIEHLAFKSGSFDLVICNGVLDYLLTDKQTLSEMKRILRPSGIMPVSIRNAFTPSRWSSLLKRKFGDLFRPSSRIEEYQPGISYTVKGIAKNENFRYKTYHVARFEEMVEDSGFQLVDRKTFGFPFRSLRRLNVPRRWLNRLEVESEKILRQSGIPYLSNFGMSYIGIFKKVP